MPNDVTKKCPYCAEDILAAAIKCKHCGSSLDSPPTASAEKTDSAKVVKHAVWIILVTLVVVWVVSRFKTPSEPPIQQVTVGLPNAESSEPGAAQSSPPAPSEPAARPTPIVVLPVTEFKLIDIVSSAQRESAGAANDMQRGGFKNKRDKALCALMTKMQVGGWIGKIDDISANSDGKGVLSIALDTDILVETYNNEFSDGLSGDKTLMDPNSALFVKVSSLKKGDTVRFSGTFFRQPADGEDASDCLQENSLTLEGKLSKPEFIFRFEKVDPIT